MLPDAVDDAERVPHGGTRDRDVVDHSANVNPRRPDGVDAVYRDALADAARYPDDDYPGFRQAAADYVSRATPESTAARGSADGAVAPGHVVPTPGGLAAIRLAMATTLDAGDRVLLPAPSFGEYAREVTLQGATPAFVSHDRIAAVGRGGDDDPLDDPGAAGSHGGEAPGRTTDSLSAYAMVVVCNPNNPTGEAVDAEALRALAERCRRADATLLVDEAFLGFTDEPSIAGEPGVVVARSLTKLFGLPGLRAGFAVATGRERDRLATARRAWNLSTPAAAVGTHCLQAREFVSRTRDRVARERDRVREALPATVDAFDAATGCQDGVAPFVLLDVGERNPSAVVDACHDHGVAIRDATTFRRLDRHVRVAVRTPSENDAMLEALASALAEVPER